MALSLSISNSLTRQAGQWKDRESTANRLCCRFIYSIIVYEQFVGRRLHPGERIDVFLTELRRIAVPFGGLSDQMLACAFVLGLPDTVEQLSRAGSRLGELADVTSGLLCFQCNQPNNLARDCLLRRKGRGDSYGGRGRGAGRGSARCYRCGGSAHEAWGGRLR